MYLLLMFLHNSFNPKLIERKTLKTDLKRKYLMQNLTRKLQMLHVEGDTIEIPVKE